MAGNNDYLSNGLQMWQDYTRAYADFAVEATRWTLEQSVAVRQQLGQLMVDAVKESLELSSREQEMALGVIEEVQTQVQAATERFEKVLAAGAAE